MDIETSLEAETHWHPESDPHQTEFGEIPTHLQLTRPAIKLTTCSPTKRDRKSNNTDNSLNPSKQQQQHKTPSTKSVLIKKSTLTEDVGDEADDEEGEEEERAQFRSKRAGHYNEFKILQALRNKIHSEEDEEDLNEEDEND